MNGNWAGGMLPNAMMGSGLPQFHWPAQIMSFQTGLQFRPQLPQNLQLPVPVQGPPTGAPFPEPGQPQFFPTRPPSVSTAPSFPPSAGFFPSWPPSVESFPSGPPSINSFPTNPPSATSFQPGPPTCFPAGAPTSASLSSLSSFLSGPPSVASFSKAGNAMHRFWLHPKPKMADALCGDSFAIPERMRRARLPKLDRLTSAAFALDCYVLN